MDDGGMELASHHFIYIESLSTSSELLYYIYMCGSLHAYDRAIWLT